MALNYGSTYVKHILQQSEDKDKAIKELVEACQMSLNWINNLVDKLGANDVIDSMPNNCGGRFQLHAAIDNGLKLLEEQHNEHCR